MKLVHKKGLLNANRSLNIEAILRRPDPNSNTLYNKINPDLNVLLVALYTQQMNAPPEQQLVSNVIRLVTFQISVDLNLVLLGSNSLLHSIQLETGMVTVEAKIDIEVNQDEYMKLNPHKILQLLQNP